MSYTPLQHANGGAVVYTGPEILLSSPPLPLQHWWCEGGGESCKQCGAQVCVGDLDLIDDCFSTVNGSTGNPAFPIPQALGIGNEGDAL